MREILINELEMAARSNISSSTGFAHLLTTAYDVGDQQVEWLRFTVELVTLTSMGSCRVTDVHCVSKTLDIS